MFLKILFDVLSVIFVIFAIGFCIFSHELGHFLAAKLLGLHVDAFSIGFKAFWKKKYKGVEYRLGMIPVGGYCEIPQIDATDETPKAADGAELRRAKPYEKIVTAAAGPLFNIISGALLACIIWVWGMPQDTPKMRAITVRSVDEKGPEYAAGLRKGDKIVKLNGKRFFCTWAKFTEQLIYTNGEVELTVERGGETRVVRYVPRENPDAPLKLRNERIPYPFFLPLVPIELVPRKGGVADKAGVRPGDRIVEIDGRAVTDYLDYQLALDRSQGKPLKFKVLRGDRIVEIAVIPRPIAGRKGDVDYYLVGVNWFTDGKPERNLEIAALIPGGAAEKAGIRPGDKIVELDGRAVKTNAEVSAAIRGGKGKPVKLKLERGGETVAVELVPDKYTPMTIDAEISLRDHPSPWRQFASTAEMSWKALSGIGIAVGNKLGLTKKSSQIKPRHLSGPLGMGTVLFTSIRHSTFSVVIYFLVLISFALAIFNLLPLPVLDGGHILFGCVELIIRRPLPVKVVKALYTTFAVLLILLMIYATFNDVRRIYNNRRTEPPNPEAKSEAKTAVPAAPANPEPAKPAAPVQK